jgi:hypothetical protein
MIRSAIAPLVLGLLLCAGAGLWSFSRQDTAADHDASVIHVRGITLEDDEAIDGRPSARLAFEMSNDGPERVEDVVFLVTIRAQAASPTENGDVIGGPYMIRARVRLEPGSIADYQLRLSNLAADCSCMPEVRVLSATVGVRQRSAPARPLPPWTSQI